MKFNKPIGEPVEPGPQLRNAREPEALDPDSFPHRTQRGTLSGTIENVRHLLDGYDITARYDLIRKKAAVTLVANTERHVGHRHDNLK